MMSKDDSVEWWKEARGCRAVCGTYDYIFTTIAFVNVVEQSSVSKIIIYTLCMY